jgi:hypothetical protein
LCGLQALESPGENYWEQDRLLKDKAGYKIECLVEGVSQEADTVCESIAKATD